MTAPVLYIPVALIFWGYQMGTLWIAVILAGLIGGAGMSKIRFEFQTRDINKFVDISIILMAAVIVLGLTIEPKTAVWFLFKWIPAALFPIIAVQQISTQGRIDIRSFYFATRKKRTLQKTDFSRKIDFSYGYALICMLSAGMSAYKDTKVTRVPVQEENLVYFLVCAILLVWALWRIRSPRFVPWIWGGLIAGILVTGFFGQKMVRHVSLDIRRWIISQYMGAYSANPFKSFTALGEIGRLKLSGKIVIRADAIKDNINLPIYLQNGIYTLFVNGNWFNRDDFKPLESTGDQFAWIIIPDSPGQDRMTLYATPSMRRLVLSLPEGAVRISNLKAEKCMKNSMQIVRAEGLPPFVKIGIEFAGHPVWDPEPKRSDLVVPQNEAAVLQQVLDGLKIQGKTVGNKIQIIKKYLADHFSYSLDLAGKGNAPTPLQNFLLNTKKGHCELFATATVLLLRQAGIPARYVTGFLMHEFSRFENQYVARERDAHAWARVYVDKEWMDFDTTPENFYSFDQSHVSVSTFRDFLSFIAFQTSKIRYETGKKFLETYGIWLILPLVLILFIRLRQASRIKRADRQSMKTPPHPDQRIAESFYLLEKHLAAKGYPRKRYETYDTWIQRILKERIGKDDQVLVGQLLFLHKKMVYGKGLTRDQENLLFGGVRRLIDRCHV